ncbi:hypothetical protein BDF20DRAFT_900314 [Mycotypha africana]|uniref:uncharacterized protein n=1 Tax=Mycotypha africana TaxID=64632 RepID=UPI0023004F06|nr:uncharacterized protein BDF20DRAFT_900314 [Mycotypha africana]KAI8967618.1 hypothetical protein BDF20DRAFT_900314 [Mycotypha africana]
MFKRLNSAIPFINCIARKYLDASFSTLKRVQVFSVQSIKQTITLSSTQVDMTKMGYCHIEHRKAEMPVTTKNTNGSV